MFSLLYLHLTFAAQTLYLNAFINILALPSIKCKCLVSQSGFSTTALCTSLFSSHSNFTLSVPYHLPIKNQSDSCPRVFHTPAQLWLTTLSSVFLDFNSSEFRTGPHYITELEENFRVLLSDLKEKKINTLKYKPAILEILTLETT